MAGTVNRPRSVSFKKPTVDADVLLRRLAEQSHGKEARSKSAGTDTKKTAEAKHAPGKLIDRRHSTKTESKDDAHDEEMDEEELASFRELFSMLNQSETGGITPEHLFEEIQKVDNDITFEEVEAVFRTVDKDGSGTIDFDELVHYITHMGEDVLGGADEEKKKLLKKKRKSILYAITQFSYKKALAHIEKTLEKSPHVIGHYSAGARLIGLTTRQLTKQMKKMQKTASKNDSPYAKPLMFVHMGTINILRRKSPSRADGDKPDAKKRKSPSRAPDSEADGDKSDIEEDLGGIDANLWKRLKLFSLKTGGRSSLDAEHIIEHWKTVSAASERAKSASLAKMKTGRKCVTKQGVDFVRCKSAKAKEPAVSRSPVRRRGTVHKGWVTPRISYLDVPLPSLKMKKSHKPTFNDQTDIRAKAKDATDNYYHQLRQTEIKHAWEHWDRLYAGYIRPKKLLDNFKKIYNAYSPHRESQSFVVCPWAPGPFCVLHHPRSAIPTMSISPPPVPGYSSRPLTPSRRHSLSRPSSPEPFQHRNNLVIRPLTPVVRLPEFTS